MSKQSFQTKFAPDKARAVIAQITQTQVDEQNRRDASYEGAEESIRKELAELVEGLLWTPRELWNNAVSEIVQALGDRKILNHLIVTATGSNWEEHEEATAEAERQIRSRICEAVADAAWCDLSGSVALMWDSKFLNTVERLVSFGRRPELSRPRRQARKSPGSRRARRG